MALPALLSCSGINEVCVGSHVLTGTKSYVLLLALLCLLLEGMVVELTCCVVT